MAKRVARGGLRPWFWQLGYRLHSSKLLLTQNHGAYYVRLVNKGKPSIYCDSQCQYSLFALYRLGGQIEVIRTGIFEISGVWMKDCLTFVQIGVELIAIYFCRVISYVLPFSEIFWVGSLHSILLIRDFLSMFANE